MTAGAAIAEGEIEVDGRRVALHHLDKVFWPRLGLTKADLVNYYLSAAPYLLPHLRGRPFIMKPYPDGAGGRSYYRWEVPNYAPAWLHRWPYRARTEERTLDMLIVEGLPELVWAVNLGCIEMHPWLSRHDDPEHPDVVVFDLDPGAGAGFAGALEVAAWLHELLDELDVRNYVKTTGRHGLHVLVPAERRYSYRQVRQWVQAVSGLVAGRHPRRVTLDKARQARRGKVLIDYSQNGLGKSIASVYSARATAEATVSTPLTWQEVAAGQVRPGDLTVLTVLERVRARGDLLAPLLEGQPLPPLPGAGL